MFIRYRYCYRLARGTRLDNRRNYRESWALMHIQRSDFTVQPCPLGRSDPNGKVPTVRRSPRLLVGKKASALTKLLYKGPEFFVTVNGDKGVTQFKFRVSVPEEIRQTYAAALEPFFGSGVINWERALSEAYWNAKWGKKKVPHVISNIFGVVYKDALRRWLGDSWDMTIDERRKDKHLRLFSKAVRPKQFLKPAVRDLRNRLRKSANKGNQTLANEIPNSLSPDILRSALSRLGGLQASEAFRTLFARGITEQQIAEEYLKCEMPELIFGPGKPSMDKYNRLGEQLLKALSRIRCLSLSCSSFSCYQPPRRPICGKLQNCLLDDLCVARLAYQTFGRIFMPADKLVLLSDNLEVRVRTTR
jgi:hypothetical protein